MSRVQPRNTRKKTVVGRGDFDDLDGMGISDNVFDPTDNAVIVGERIANCSTRPTQAERSRCIEAMLHGRDELQVHRVLGKETASSQRIKPVVPQTPFHDVAGVVLNDKRDAIHAVVMHDGSVRRLPSPISLPSNPAPMPQPQPQSQPRPQPQQQRDENPTHIMAEHQMRKMVIEQSRESIEHDQHARDLASRLTAQASLKAKEAVRESKAAQAAQAEAIGMERQARASQQAARARSSRITDAEEDMEERDAEHDAAQVGRYKLDSDENEREQDNQVPLAPPMVGGSLAVVTPATEQDARELKQQVAHAQPLSHDQHAKFVKELSTVAAQYDAHEEVIHQAIETPPMAPPMTNNPTKSLSSRPQNASMLGELRLTGASKLRRVEPAPSKPASSSSDHDKLMEAVRARAAQRDSHPNDHFLVKSGADMIPVTRPKPDESPKTMMSALAQQLAQNRAAIQPAYEDDGDSGNEFDDDNDGDKGVGGAGENDNDDDDDEEPEVERLERVLRNYGHVVADTKKRGVMHQDELFALVNRAYTSKFYVPGSQDEWWSPDAAMFKRLLQLVRTYEEGEDRDDDKELLDSLWAFIMSIPDDDSVDRRGFAAFYKFKNGHIAVPTNKYLTSLQPALSMYPRV
jgi:hypothetical protein